MTLTVSRRLITMSVEDLLNRIIPPPPQVGSLSREVEGEPHDSVTKLYHEIYAPGLSNFFETTWFYFVEQGKMAFPSRHGQVFGQWLSSLKREEFEGNVQRRPSQTWVTAAKEARMVWRLARLAYETPPTVPPATTSLPPWGDALEARRRVEVVEALVSGTWLPINPLTYPFDDPDTQRVRQFGFWYALGDLVRRRDETNVSLARGIRDGCLARMRMYTCGCENRDLIYSMAVARELGKRYEPNQDPTNTERLDENVPQNRLSVARRHISTQSQPDGGSTNVLRRVAFLGMLAFVEPNSMPSF